MKAARLLELLYLMAPAYAANMAPPLVRYWRGCVVSSPFRSTTRPS
jgi:hypothetical protein